MPISDETKEKVRNVWSRPFADLPVAKDLPRLAKFMVISDEDGLVIPYHEKHLYDLEKRKGDNGLVPIDFKLFLHVRRVLLSLTIALQGKEKARELELALDAQTDYENFFLPEVLTAFLAANLGDDTNPVIRVLKCCNQSAIAPALIELKFALGVENTTKDVSNSWRLIVIISADKVRAMNQKRELCIGGRFELKWELSVCMERPSMDRLEDIYLKVVDLSFNYGKQTPKRVQETRNLVKKYCDNDFWQQTASKTLCMMQEDPSAIHLAETPPLLEGEKVMSRFRNVGFVHVQHSLSPLSEGTLCITNYCIFFQSTDSLNVFTYQLPLMDIAKVAVKKKERGEVDIVGKSIRTVRLTFQAKEFKAFLKNIAAALPSNVPRVFAMSFGRATQLNRDVSECTSKAIMANGWRLYNAEDESERMCIDPSQWRLSTINRHFQLCDSYPHTLVVPAAVGDADLLVSAHKRLGGRIPALSWQSKNYGFLCHGARPQVTKSELGTPGSDDAWNEDVLLAMVRNCSRRLAEAAEESQLGNRGRVERIGSFQGRLSKKLKPLRRGTNVGIRTGTEESCDFYIIDIFRRADSGKVRELDSLFCKEVPAIAIGRDALFLEPMADVKDSYRKLHKLCSMAPSANVEEHWQTAVDGTRWLEQLRTLLQCASRVVEVMSKGSSVMLTYMEEWDRACQISSLAQVCMDPFFRTTEGFIVLIEKEWLSFGHPFSDRSGYLQHDDSVEEVPMCLQFLDCVWQIMQQYPSYFEFTDQLLITIADELYTGRYGTFMCNNDAARRSFLIRLNTESLWTSVLKEKDRYANPFFAAHMYPVIPSANARVIALWSNYFLRWYEGETMALLPRTSRSVWGNDILTNTPGQMDSREEIQSYLQSLRLARNAIDAEIERHEELLVKTQMRVIKGIEPEDALVKSASLHVITDSSPVMPRNRAAGSFIVTTGGAAAPVRGMRGARSKKKTKRTKSMSGLPRETLSGLRSLVRGKEGKIAAQSDSFIAPDTVRAVPPDHPTIEMDDDDDLPSNRVAREDSGPVPENSEIRMPVPSLPAPATPDSSGATLPPSLPAL